MSSDDDEEIYSIYDTKTICNRFNSQFEQLRSQFKKNVSQTSTTLKNAVNEEKCERDRAVRKKDIVQEKNKISTNDATITKPTKQDPKNEIVEEESSDSDSNVSIQSLGEVENEDRSNLNQSQKKNALPRNCAPLPRNDDLMSHILYEEPPARSTRARQKKSVTPNQPLINTSPVKKKKRGPIDSFFKPINSNEIVALDKKAEDIILIEEDEDEEEEEDEDVNFEVSVKILWKSRTVRKFTLRKFQKFSKIFEHFMKEENVSSDKIILTLKGRKVKSTDSPESLNLKVYDIIDGGVLSAVSNNFNSSIQENEVDDDNMVAVKFQDNNKKIVKLKLRKTDKMKIVMIKYAEQIEVPVDKIKFLFDGDVLDPAETPTTLGIDNEEIIDVKFLEKN